MSSNNIIWTINSVKNKTKKQKTKQACKKSEGEKEGNEYIFHRCELYIIELDKCIKHNGTFSSADIASSHQAGSSLLERKEKREK